MENLLDGRPYPAFEWPRTVQSVGLARDERVFTTSGERLLFAVTVVPFFALQLSL